VLSVQGKPAYRNITNRCEFSGEESLMNIVVDIGHPAHVHLFKNFMWEMVRRGHRLLITATEKDVATDLLHNYGFDYLSLGSYGNSVIEKAVNIPLMDIKMYRAVRSFKPDIFVGVSPIRAAHAAVILRKPCIAFDDSEPSPFEQALYVPFVQTVFPSARIVAVMVPPAASAARIEPTIKQLATTMAVPRAAK